MTKIGIVGATGMVGQEAVRLLNEYGFFEGAEVRLMASGQSVGEVMEVRGVGVMVEGYSEGFFEGMDVALFCVEGELAREYYGVAEAAGCMVVDNSSAFRMEEWVPLVVAEVNGEELGVHRGLVANPNCVVMLLMMVIGPLKRRFGVKGFVVSTYQAVSGAGKRGVEALREESGRLLRGEVGEVGKERWEGSVFPYGIGFNLFPEIGRVEGSGYTEEEEKIMRESRKVLGDGEMRVSATCVRVPLMRVHSASVVVELGGEVELGEVEECLRGLEWVEYYGNGNGSGLMAGAMEKRREVGVGRLRRDGFVRNGVSFWVSGDQLMKGAALNGLQLMEMMVGRKKETKFKEKLAI